MKGLTRLLGAASIAHQTLRSDPARTLLGVAGVAVAVLTITLLLSVGHGVLETGQEKFDASGRDLWITGDPVALAPGSLGGIQNGVTDAHRVSTIARNHTDVQHAIPLLFQVVYAGPTPDTLRPHIAVGTPGLGPAVAINEGEGFRRGDTHYADGTYTGPLTHEALMDPRAADAFSLSPGDTLHIGGTVASARNHRYTVRGISPTFSTFLDGPTVVLHLSELQDLTAKSGTDQATYITVTLKDTADPEHVRNDLQERLPGYTVRTNQEQLRDMLQQKILTLASGAVLGLIGIIGGAAMTITLLTLTVHQRRREIAALKAIGLTSSTLSLTHALQGLGLGIAGGALGLGLTPLASGALNTAAHHLVGFQGLVQTPPGAYLAGATAALLLGTLSAWLAARRVSRQPPLTNLDN